MKSGASYRDILSDAGSFYFELLEQGLQMASLGEFVMLTYFLWLSSVLKIFDLVTNIF